MTAGPGKSRFDGFDYLRAVAIVAVVYIHGCDTNATMRYAMKWMGFAVPCFFMMSAFLAQWTILHRERSYIDLIRSRLIRLTPPFYVWSAIYLAVRYLKSLKTGATIDSGLFGCLFWGDASYQLYFVPMLFYSFVGWTGLMLMARKRRMLASGLMMISAAVFIAIEPLIAERIPGARWFIAPNLAWFPIGMLMAVAASTWGTKLSLLRWPAVTVGAASFATGWINTYLVATCVFLIALSIRRSAPAAIKSVAGLSYGIYLLHVLIIETMQFGLPRLGIANETLAATALITLSAAVGSYLICWAISKIRRIKWVVA